MSRPDYAEYAEFFKQEHPRLVKFVLGRGMSLSDAEDVAQTVFMRVFTRWATVQKPRAYLYQAARHEAAELAQRQRRHLDTPLRRAASHVERSAEDVYHQRDAGIVRDSLIVLPSGQRKVMTRVCAGHRTNEIAEVLGTSTSTVRSNLRHGRETLRLLLHGDRQNLHRRAGERLYEAYQCGDPLPAAPRLMILQAWDEAKAHKVNPQRGTDVDPLGWDEVKRRRRESPIATCPWALDALAELGKTTRQMMVVVDVDGVVLCRGGDRGVLRLADQLGFVEGAHWDIKHAGANGIALALMTGRTETVCGWEHYVQAQHGLSCVAAPICDPQGRAHCVLNLTGTQSTIHHAILREIDTIAMRVHRQLRTSWTPPT
jgi:RNA polymerase sigma factor (sigma-70 family)